VNIILKIIRAIVLTLRFVVRMAVMFGLASAH
jgi:hypothetical protein